MSNSNCYVLTFDIPSEYQTYDSKKTRILYSDLKRYFATQGDILRLFTNFNEWYAKIYCADLKSAEDLKAAVLANNKYNLQFDEITQESRNMAGGEKQVSAKVAKKVININGAPVTLLTDDKDNQYVSVQQARETGFNLFSSETDAKRHVITSLQDYLESQAQFYLDMMHLDYRVPYDIQILVRFANEKGQQSNSKNKNYNQTRNTKWSPQIKNSSNFNKSTNSLNSSSSASSINLNTSIEKPSERFANMSAKIKPLVMSGMTPRQLLNNLNRKMSKPMPIQTSTPVAKPIKRAMSLNSKKRTQLDAYPSGSVYVDKMMGGIEVNIHILKITSDIEFIGFIMCADSIDFEDVLETADLDYELLTPCVGEMVLIKPSKEKRSRAIILEILDSTYKVAALELGEVLEVNAVYEMPKELHDLDEFVCSCEASPSLVKSITVDDGIDVIAKSENLLEHIATKTFIKCKRWVPDITPSNLPPLETESPKSPKPEQKIYTAIPADIPPIKIDDKVKLIGFDLGILYLRSHVMYQLITNLNKKLHEMTLEPLERPPTIGQYVLFKVDKVQPEWRRCLVKEISENGITIQHIDYYQTQGTVPLNMLRNFVDCALFGPTISQMRLRHFEEKQYSENAQQYLIDAIKKTFIVSYLRDAIIDLKADSSAKYLSQVLIDLDLPQFYTVRDLPVFDVEFDKEFHLMVIHVNDDGTMYFMVNGECVNSLTELMKQLNKMKDFETVENASVGQLCIVQVDGDWCRGVIEEFNGNQVKVFFIDFANTENVKLDQIKVYPDSFLDVGGCALKGIITAESKLKAAFNTAYVAIAKQNVNGLYHLQLVHEIEEE